MQNFCLGAHGAIAIGGIKVSPALVQFNLLQPAPGLSEFPAVLRRIAEDRINLSFLTQSQVEGGVACCFCVAEQDAGSVQALMDMTVSDTMRVGRIGPVATVSIFPHRNSLVLLGAVLRILGAAGISVHALCTSLSAVAVNIDYHSVDRVIEEFRKSFDLPANHAPFHPEPAWNPDGQ